MPRRLDTDKAKTKGEPPETVARRDRPTPDPIEQTAASKTKGHTPAPKVVPIVIPHPAIDVVTHKKVYAIDGQDYGRVTSLIDGGVPKPALFNWAKKVVADTALDSLDFLPSLIERGGVDAAAKWLKDSTYRTRDAAAQQGTYLHEAMEAHLLGGEYSGELTQAIQDNENLNPMIQHGYDLLANVADRQAWSHVEAFVFSPAHGYAGTLDGILTTSEPSLVKHFGGDERRGDSVTLLADWKTSRFVYDTHSLQLTAYRYAEKMLDRETGQIVDRKPVDVDGAVVLHVRPEGWKVVPVATTARQFDVFLGVTETARWMNTEARPSVGKAILTGG